ncbi:DUF1015 family protein [Pedobacter mucosus]|uniref:DUF1015 family protein n=1 Tax=Pedobacter mucosus TaxID=2895286 RepID=UPI001EE44E01|nr:DUF1015 domain-containing protein [Pedobacter mucosus]UKT64986.1 DUF1015 domain-containing protein [Pedobacter mucosus]
MAIVRAFRPLCSSQTWFENLLRGDQCRISLLRSVLEARGGSGIGEGDKGRVQSIIEEMIERSELYIEEEDSIYIYEQETHLGIQRGIWLQTGIQDLLDGVILGHEHTLSDREERLARYRTEVGLEGSPVLLCYRPDEQINRILKGLTERDPAFRCGAADTVHRLWKISEVSEVNQIIARFLSIEKVYIGDGHHRISAAARAHRKSPQWIMALYVSAPQLRISSFNRMILEGPGFEREKLMHEIKKLYYVSGVPGNVRYLPDRIHRIGLFLEGEWYQLDLKPELYALCQLTDVYILQERILGPVLGISDPSSDPRLICFPDAALDETVERSSGVTPAVLFTVYPISVHRLLEQAESGIYLPPKSSFIEPKVPYALMLNAEAIIENLEQ